MAVKLDPDCLEWQDIALTTGLVSLDTLHLDIERYGPKSVNEGVHRFASVIPD